MQAMMELQTGADMSRYENDPEVTWFLVKLKGRMLAAAARDGFAGETPSGVTGLPGLGDGASVVLLGGVAQGEADASAGETELFTCMHLCGFTGTFQVVEEHEQICPLNPAAQARAAGDA